LQAISPVLAKQAWETRRSNLLSMDGIASTGQERQSRNDTQAKGGAQCLRIHSSDMGSNPAFLCRMHFRCSRTSRRKSELIRQVSIFDA